MDLHEQALNPNPSKQNSVSSKDTELLQNNLKYQKQTLTKQVSVLHGCNPTVSCIDLKLLQILQYGNLSGTGWSLVLHNLRLGLAFKFLLEG